jgi:hypothetical protein
MKRRLFMSVKDELFAAGLMCILVVFSIPLAYVFPNTSRSVPAGYSLLMVIGIAIVILFMCASGLRHGTFIQKMLAMLFAIPPLIFIWMIAPKLGLVCADLVR